MPLVDVNINDTRILDKVITTYREHRMATFPKWQLPDYERFHNFYVYEQKMLSLLQDAELHEIATGVEVELPDDPNKSAAVNDNRKVLFNLGNSIVYTLIHRTFTAANKGFEDSAGVPANDGRALWVKLTLHNYKLTATNIPNLKLDFYACTKYKQVRG